MMPNNTIYVETNRDTIQSVFDMLLPKYNGRIFLAPTKEIATTYIDFSKENIIVKPLVTEAPLTLDGKVPVPTLEKLLVDTRVDADFYYEVGKWLEPANGFQEDRWKDSSPGIHFFLDREQCVAYQSK
jgi:hypothetical protein